jgi:hypothetical protein
MLGFSSYSEAPISQAGVGSEEALGYLAGNVAVSSGGTLLLDAEAVVQAPTTIAFTDVNILFDAKASTGLADIAASLDVNSAYASGGTGASTTVSSVTSTAGVHDVLTYAKATTSLVSLPATLLLNSVGTAAIAFAYQPDQYTKSRVLFVRSYENAYTVHILPENNVVYIHKRQGDNTVHIAA